MVQKAGALTSNFTRLLVRLQFWLEEMLVNCDNWRRNTSPARADVPQVRLKAHIHLQKLIYPLPLSVPLLHTKTHYTINLLQEI